MAKNICDNVFCFQNHDGGCISKIGTYPEICYAYERYSASQNKVEALTTNTASLKLPCPHLDNVGGCCKKVGHTKCTCDYVNRQLRAAQPPQPESVTPKFYCTKKDHICPDPELSCKECNYFKLQPESVTPDSRDCDRCANDGECFVTILKCKGFKPA